MQGATGLYFSFPGAKVEVEGSEAFKPVVDPKPPKKAPPPPKGQISQRFKVTLPADAPLGIHDVRIVTANGISNPRAFVVGDLQEFTEQEPNDDLPKAQKIAVNSTVSGVISVGTDVDYYLFTGKKGQRIVVSCLTTSIDSKLPAEIDLYNHLRHVAGPQQGLSEQRRPARCRAARRRRLLRPRLQLHLHAGRARLFLPPDGQHRSVDRRRVSAGHRAGQGGQGDGLWPQPARRRRRPGQHARRQGAGKGRA